MCDLNETYNKLVSEALKNDDINSYELKICGGNQKGEGYIGDITFVKVVAKKSDGAEARYSLVLKIGGKNKTLRPIVRLGFEREIHIYAKIIPAFWKLQDECNLPRFKAIPKCYLTILTDHEEALVLENIKSMGFKLHDRRTAMNLAHMKLVLAMLGQWHALSFALNCKKPEEFKKLTSNWTCLATEMYVNSHVGQWMNVSQQHLLRVLQESGDLELLKKYQEKTKGQLPTEKFRDILASEEDHVVITHGDCWNNNLMFKYQNEDLSVPLEVATLDFQISSISSPALDLSYFIYAVASEEQLNHFPELLKTYYDSLSNYLKRMDCDANTLFPYSELERHWNQYSAYGALIAPLTACDNLVDTDQAANYGNKNQKYEDIIESVDRTHQDIFRSRLVAVAKHFTYCEL